MAEVYLFIELRVRQLFNFGIWYHVDFGNRPPPHSSIHHKYVPGQTIAKRERDERGMRVGGKSFWQMVDGWEVAGRHNN